VRRELDDAVVVTVGLSQEFVASTAAAAGVAVAKFRVMGRISDEELAALYREATCVAMPSNYEGFGLMAVEALACGTPTVYVCDAVDEVVGDTGFRATENSAEAYADALSRAVCTPHGDRDRLIARSRRFAWDDSARAFQQVVSDVVQMIEAQS
jgi:glycosyltransferase involved in cell wall biosynthesis